ncbi:MAG: hypothetical protein LW823_03405 [Rickettsiales bacterium]|jgi:hypothetical protein|nr:hypothetical protein [Rickettsiales bacterium]
MSISADEYLAYRVGRCHWEKKVKTEPEMQAYLREKIDQINFALGPNRNEEQARAKLFQAQQIMRDVIGAVDKSYDEVIGRTVTS